jgi:hypothetical protein
MSESTWKAIAITAAVIAGLVFFITLLMISRIKIAVACIKVSQDAYCPKTPIDGIGSIEHRA